MHTFGLLLSKQAALTICVNGYTKSRGTITHPLFMTVKMAAKPIVLAAKRRPGSLFKFLDFILLYT